MVSIAAKAATLRTAKVAGEVRVSAVCAAKLDAPAVQEIVRTARLAGIQASKQTPQLIPLCHQVALAAADLVIEFVASAAGGLFAITAITQTEAQTGVEMEALTAAAIAGLTIYDMIKAVDPAATIGSLRLLEKQGGKAGTWSRSHD